MWGAPDNFGKLRERWRGFRPGLAVTLPASRLCRKWELRGTRSQREATLNISSVASIMAMGLWRGSLPL